MSYTNETTHYHIPKPLGTDLTTPMDYNDAADAIDTAVWGAVQDAAQATSDAADAKLTATGAAEDVAELEGTVTTLSGTVGAQGEAITGLTNEVGDVRTDLSDAICAVKEATATASYQHLIGEYFWYNDTLYRATAGIAIGDTIVPNTNCVATNVVIEVYDKPAFIDTSNRIARINTQGGSWVATRNCWAIAMFKATDATNAYVTLNGLEIASTAGTDFETITFPVKLGQTVATRADHGEYLVDCYGMLF